MRKLSTDTNDYKDLAYIENGEYKSLGDKENNKYNAGKEPETFERIFRIKNKNKKTVKKTENSISDNSDNNQKSDVSSEKKD